MLYDDLVVIIPARLGSKRFKQKNIQLLNGKPLLYYAIQAAKQICPVDRIYVNTESDEIAKIAIENKVRVLGRQEHLADDLSTKIEVIQDSLIVLETQKAKQPYVLTIQANSPELVFHVDKLQHAVDILKHSDRQEVIAVDDRGFQHGSFRAWKWDHMSKYRNLGFKMAAVCCNVVDIHHEEDLELVKERWSFYE